MLQLRLIKTIILFSLLASLLAGCTAAIWNRYPPPKPDAKQGAIVGGFSGAAIGGAAGSLAGLGFGAVAGTVIGASIGDIFHSHMNLVDKLQYNGIQVIQLGDEIKLILPTGKFFKPNSALMNANYYPILDLVATFIKQFPKVDIKIAGYTNDVGPWQRNLALSLSQAKSILRYLWNYGIDARLAYAVGYGSKHPIANNHSAHGRLENNRIEISLRKVREYDDY